MALIDTFPDHNSWREAGRSDTTAPGRDRRTNRWSDAAALGDEVEGFLSTVPQPTEVAPQRTSFLAAAEAPVPGTRTNNWREPLDERDASA
jgi:hypothetical protein